MGVSVISTSTASAVAGNSALTATGTSATDALSGDFAALLFGEIQSLLAPPSAESEKSTSTAGLDETSKLVALADKEASTSIVDPAMMAALLGSTQTTPSPANIGVSAVPTLDKSSEEMYINATPAQIMSNETSEKKYSNATPAIISLDKLSEKQHSDVTPVNIVKEPGSVSIIPADENGNALAAVTKKAIAPPLLTYGIQSQGANGVYPDEAANIAVEAKAADAITTALANDVNTFGAGRQTVESISPVRQSHIDTPLHSSTWPQQFSEKIVWLARNDQQSAQININPPQLGPIQITVNLSGGDATLAFASPHAEVRQAIESALPQLKEMLSSAGINLGQSNVGANLSQQNPDNPFHAANANRSANENAILPANDKAATMGSSQVLQRGRGLVDLFA